MSGPTVVASRPVRGRASDRGARATEAVPTAERARGLPPHGGAFRFGIRAERFLVRDRRARGLRLAVGRSSGLWIVIRTSFRISDLVSTALVLGEGQRLDRLTRRGRSLMDLRQIGVLVELLRDEQDWRRRLSR